MHMSKIPETFCGVTEEDVKLQGNDFLNELSQIVSVKGLSQRVELVEVKGKACVQDLKLPVTHHIFRLFRHPYPQSLLPCLP